MGSQSHNLNTFNTLNTVNMVGEGFLAWILSALAIQQTGNPVTTTDKMDVGLNITMANTGIKQERPFTILVEGNVGSGKSTFLSIVEKLPGIKTFPEPVESWQQVGRQNLLYDMYADKHRWFTTLTNTSIMGMEVDLIVYIRSD